MLEKIFLAFVLYFGLDVELNAMPSENLAFYGCPTSQKLGILLFKIPSVCADESREKTDSTNNERQAWLNLVLRIRELTLELEKKL